MNNHELAIEILKKIGGEKNVESVIHCATRLRFTTKNEDLVELDNLKDVEGIIAAQNNNGQIQIIIGPDVYKVYDEVVKELGNIKENKEVKKESKQSIINQIVEFISGVFIPVTISLGGAGLIKGLLSLATSMAWLEATSDIYILLNLISDAPFYYLPFLLAYSTAKKINTNEFLAITLSGIIMYPTLISGAAEGASPLMFFGLEIPMLSYASSIIPIVLGVFVMKYVYMYLKKIIPSSMEFIITSGLTLFITSVIVLIAVAPAGTYLGEYVSSFFQWLYDFSGPLAGILFGGSFAVLVMTGMAYAILPVSLQNLQVLGYDYVMLPIMTMSNINQGIANFAVSLKTKNAKMRSTAVGTGLTAVLGITEPAMYSVNLRYKKPFYASLIGTAVAGGLTRVLDVNMFSFAGGGIFSIPAYNSTDYPSNFMNAIICLVIGCVITFVLTFIWTTKKDFAQADGEMDSDKVVAGEYEVSSVGKGKVISIKDVPDKTFSSNLIGEGVAVDIIDDYIYAPFAGRIKAIYPTNHAIGIESDNGIEVLIHIGVDTVKIDDAGFESLVNEGQMVEKGEQLLKFDYKKLKEHDVYTPTIVVVTNSQEFKSIKVTEEKEVSKNDSLFIVKS